MVDYIRHSYTTEMRFGTDLAQSALIKWQFCQEGALPLGIPTPFVSRDHDAWETWPPLGEVQEAPRNNYLVGNVSLLPGTHGPCGDPDVWLNGWPGTVPPNFPRTDLGHLWCCSAFAALPGEPRLLFRPGSQKGNLAGNPVIAWSPGTVSPAYFAWVPNLLQPVEIEDSDMVTSTLQLTTAWVETVPTPTPPPPAPWIPFAPTVYPPDLDHYDRDLIFGELPWEDFTLSPFPR